MRKTHNLKYINHRKENIFDSLEKLRDSLEKLRNNFKNLEKLGDHIKSPSKNLKKLRENIKILEENINYPSENLIKLRNALKYDVKGIINPSEKLEKKKYGIKELPTQIKTIKLDVSVWDNLKNMKKENETFNDVIKTLLMKRTISLGDDNIKAIKYKRNISFFKSYDFRQYIGYEYEYNDIKNNKSDFALDLKIRKIFFGKKIIQPSEFFGVDNIHKHYSNLFLLIYLKAISLALNKEFKVHFPVDFEEDYVNLALWRQTYYDYNLSEESFKNDIEEPLRLSEEDSLSEKWKERIKNSVVGKLSKK